MPPLHWPTFAPPLTLFSVFFWSYIWGLFGAFIGVPITIALVIF
jgi:predicted PurR-regulated permease PerM